MRELTGDGYTCGGESSKQPFSLAGYGTLVISGADGEVEYIGGIDWDNGCRMACDDDCEIGPVHCWNHHRPAHKPDWHDPAGCDARAGVKTP